MKIVIDRDCRILDLIECYCAGLKALATNDPKAFLDLVDMYRVYERLQIAEEKRLARLTNEELAAPQP